jgi:hypothetical protein
MEALAAPIVISPAITRYSKQGRCEGIAVGCGGVALFDDYAGVKRMYTRPAGTRPRRNPEVCDYTSPVGND